MTEGSCCPDDLAVAWDHALEHDAVHDTPGCVARSDIFWIYKDIWRRLTSPRNETAYAFYTRTAYWSPSITWGGAWGDPGTVRRPIELPKWTFMQCALWPRDVQYYRRVGPNLYEYAL